MAPPPPPPAASATFEAPSRVEGHETPSRAAVRKAQREAKAMRHTAINVLTSIIAGLVAGAVFLGLEYAASLVGAGTPLGPAGPTLTAFLGVQPNTSLYGSLLAAHFALSLLSILPLALVVRRLKMTITVVVGALYGGMLFALYTASTVVLLPSVAEVDLVLIINYAVFGAVGAYLTKRLGY